MDLSFLDRNRAELARLRQLVARLTDADLVCSVGDGWTVSVVLAHLAFWDRRVLVVLERWERDGKIEPSVIDSAAVNDASLPLWRAIPPRETIQLALTSAETVDRKLEATPPALLEQIQALDTLNLVRATHRAEHIAQIERALKG